MFSRRIKEFSSEVSASRAQADSQEDSKNPLSRGEKTKSVNTKEKEGKKMRAGKNSPLQEGNYAEKRGG